MSKELKALEKLHSEMVSLEKGVPNANTLNAYKKETATYQDFQKAKELAGYPALPPGYKTDGQSVGSAFNKTGGLPEGHRRVISDKGVILVQGKDGKLYKELDNGKLVTTKPLENLVQKEKNIAAGKGMTSAQGLIGRDFEDYLNQTLGGKGSFKNKGREFDGAYGLNNSIWYEAKSGRYWQDHAQASSKGFEKFKSDVGAHASIAKQNSASFEVHSNTPIPQHVKDWLTSKNIPFKEY